MIPRELASHPMTEEAIESFNRLMSLYASHLTCMGEAWRSAERILAALVRRVEELERAAGNSPTAREEHMRVV